MTCSLGSLCTHLCFQWRSSHNRQRKISIGQQQIVPTTENIASISLIKRREFPRNISSIKVDLPYTSEKCGPREVPEHYLGEVSSDQEQVLKVPQEVFSESISPPTISTRAPTRPRFHAFIYTRSG